MKMCTSCKYWKDYKEDKQSAGYFRYGKCKLKGWYSYYDDTCRDFKVRSI